MEGVLGSLEDLLCESFVYLTGHTEDRAAKLHTPYLESQIKHSVTLIRRQSAPLITLLPSAPTVQLTAVGT
jgi:hypothetical protein